MEATLEDNTPAVQAFQTGPMPSLDRGKVVELCHTAARWRKVTFRDPAREIESTHVEHISENAPITIKFSRFESFAEAGKPDWIVNLVAIHPKDPRIRPSQASDQFVALTRMRDMMETDFWRVRVTQFFKNDCCAVSRSVVNSNEFVAERQRIQHGPLQKILFILRKKNSDNPH
jgi:hypothetical protein